MSYWSSRGLRGSTLEELINQTNEKYREKKLALIQKVPTPIKPVRIDKESRHITLAYFDQKSTVDYIGVVQGIPVCFDAKECGGKRFPLGNIHEHQITFMKGFEEQQGVAFLLMYFAKYDVFYYLPFRSLFDFWQRANGRNGVKSFSYEELRPEYRISPYNDGVYIHYLEALNTDLEERDSFERSLDGKEKRNQ